MIRFQQNSIDAESLSNHRASTRGYVRSFMSPGAGPASLCSLQNDTPKANHHHHHHHRAVQREDDVFLLIDKTLLIGSVSASGCPLIRNGIIFRNFEAKVKHN